MWHYSWSWHIAHGIISEQCSAGFGWYIVAAILVVANIIWQVRR